MKNKLPQPTEHQIQNDIIGYLKYKGYYVQRMNSGVISIGEGRMRRTIRLAEVGTPDIMAFKSISPEGNITLDTSYWQTKNKTVSLLFIEVKRHGNKPTIHQHNKMLELMQYGAKCIIAFSVEDIQKVIG